MLEPIALECVMRFIPLGNERSMVLRRLRARYIDTMSYCVHHVQLGFLRAYPGEDRDLGSTNLSRAERE